MLHIALALGKLLAQLLQYLRATYVILCATAFDSVNIPEQCEDVNRFILAFFRWFAIPGCRETSDRIGGSSLQ